MSGAKDKIWFFLKETQPKIIVNQNEAKVFMVVERKPRKLIQEKEEIKHRIIRDIYIPTRFFD